ncbi:mucin-2 [Bactrocera dorsalis]|uniref:Mucin-2 n=1 Tax=Bactrocera dorsalis TaxID=27457 RepID=A0A6I9V9X5_BACDO|nr:mucin-2 [Bactrocera dorsalis]
MFKIALFAVYVIILTLHESAGICYNCNSNGVACASNNTFHLCFGGLPNLGEEYSCPNEDEVCTALGPVCMDPSSNPNIEPACGNTKQCGQCADVMDGGFTCTSRTTFTMCMGYALTDIRASCPTGQVCRTSVAQTGKVPCVNECLTDSNDMCDVSVAVDAPPSSESAGTTVIIQPTPPANTTTTTAIIQPTPAINTTTTQPGTTAEPSATSTTVSTNDSTSVSPSTNPSPVEFCASQTLVGRYSNPADNSCATYLYCSSSGSGSGFTAHIMQCPAGKFFNAKLRNCQSNKPSGCV